MNPINLKMEHKYRSEKMNNKFSKKTNLIKLVFFLFLGVWSVSAKAQCSPDINPNYSNCTGDSIQITAASGFNYSWSNGATTQSIWVTSSDSIWVVITDSICVVDSSSFFNPTLVSILNVNLSPEDTTLCANESLILSVNANSNILWSTGDTANNILVTPLSNTLTVYYVDITENGSSCRDTINVNVLPEVIINTIAVNNTSSQNACDGQIFPSASGVMPLNYQWNIGAFILPNTIGGVIDSLCENTYCLTVTDDNNCSIDTCVSVEWNPCNLNLTISNPILCNGQTATVDVEVDTTSGIGPFAFVNPRFEYSVYSLNPLTFIQVFPFGLSSFPLPYNFTAGDYLITVYDKSWQDSCSSSIAISEPAPILIYTSIDSTSATWNNDGSILIDSITGGNGGFIITWYDSSYTQSFPGTAIINDSVSVLLDSIYFSHDYYGGYSISVTDSNSCFEDTTLYVYPDSTLTNFDTVYVNQHETCFGFEDGKIFASMNDTAIRPFTFYWIDLVTSDTIRIDCFGCPNPSMYNPSHVATNTNLAPGPYALGVLDGLGNAGEFIDLIVINPADSIYVVINPTQDSITLNCGESRVLTAVPSPLPDVATLMPYTQPVFSTGTNPVSAFVLDLNTISGITFSLYESINRTYSLTCSGTATDTSNPAVNYDAAFKNWPATATPYAMWDWNVAQGNSVPLLNTSMYDGVNHTYTWYFSANSNSALNSSIAGEWLHEFRVNNTILTGQLNCQINVIIDTVMYDYAWSTLENPGVILSTADTLLTDSSIIITTDYVVSVSNSNGCLTSDTIRVKKNLNTLVFDSLIVKNVIPCYGDSTGILEIYITDSSGVSPFIYSLFASDSSFVESNSISSFTGLFAGQYYIQVEDTIGCVNPYLPAFISQPDTIFACGVDVEQDTTFNIFTATILANDPSTWNFQTSVLAPNFQYILEVSGTFGLTSLQLSTPFDQDAAFKNLNPVSNPNIGPFWTVDGDELRPDIDILNANNTYLYYNPSNVNGTGLQNDYFTGAGMPLNFVFNDPDSDTTNNQGSLTFTLHKISCTQIDTAYTCKGESIGFAFVRPASVNGSLGGIPFNNIDGEYYETEWIKYNPITGTNIATIQGGPGAGPSDIAVNLFAGSYKVVVIDSLGCSEFVRYLEVLEPIDTLAAILDTVINVSCKYDSTGEIHLKNYGGFDSIATNGSVVVPIASTTSRYAVLLRDNSIYNACGDINTIIPQANYTDTIIAFYGVLDSIIFDNLTAHRYRVYVYDSIPDATYGKYDPFTGELLSTPFNYMQCPEIIDVFISEPCDSLSAFTSVLSNVNCWGDSTGKAYVSAFGGAEPWTYSYQWHNAPFGINNLGESNDTAYHLWADTLANSFPNALWHTVTVTDLNGCTIEDSVEIKHLYKKIRPFYVNALADTIWEIKFIEDSVSCFNLCDGEVSLETFGGVYPHQYVWDVNPNTIIYNQPDTVDGLCAGGHDVLVQDNIGCQQRIRFGIDKPNQLFAVASEVSPISCFGFNDGTAHAFGIGGNNVNNQQSAYSFNWFIDGLLYNTTDSLLGVGQNIDSLPPGIHVVQVTDYKGCVATDTVEIIEPTQLSVIIVDTSTVYAYCEFTESARLCAQAFGGTPGYVYQWDDAYFQNNSSSALFENSPFCADNLTPFNINTNNGNYNVTVIDERGCVASETIDIDTITNTFNSNTISVSVLDVTCFDGYNGSITISSITGGTSSYNFLWSGPPGFSQNIQNVSSLVAGSYAVIVTDSLGCQRTKNITVNEPDQLYYSIYNSIDETCTGDGSTVNSNGSCDGQIMVNVFGGTGNYYWDETESNVSPIPNSNQVQIINDTLIKDLCSGLHNIYVTDDNNCEGQVFPGGIGILTINTLVNVNVPGVNWTPTTCSYNTDGTAWMQFPGANPLFDYTWETTSPVASIVGTGASISNLSIGNYVLVAHYGNDASFGVFYPGCDATELFTISGPLEIVPISTVAPVTCWGYSNGSIDLSVSGGIPIAGVGYTYQWDNTVSLPSGATTSTVNNLLAGTYGVTITDANGCDTTLAILITQPSQIQNDFTINDLLCYGDSDGSITPITSGGTPTGGNPPYVYNWGVINPLSVPAGTYSVTITDANGCSITDEAIVEEPNPLLLSLTSNNNYGVSSTGLPYFISCNGANDGEVLAITTGGLEPYNYAWSDLQTTNPAVSLSVGSITLDVTDANGCPVSSSIILTEPSIIIDNANLSTNSYGYEVSCFGASDGWISLDPTGGVPQSNGSYAYNWSNSSLDSVSSGIPAGNYSVSIEDANGCSYSFNYTLISPSEEFKATVSTLNYAGPSHPPVDVIFSDATIDNSGNPISVNHTWYWSNDGAADPFTDSGFDNFTHGFDELGPNDVYVLVQNVNSGCIDTVNFVIEVQGFDFSTNVFSPNGDGINDDFIFDKNGIKIISVEIYNRWGSLVMNWTDLDKGWDGTGSDGQDLPDAVYFYVLTAEGEDGYYYEDKGSITLIR